MLAVLFRDAGTPADKKLKPANSVKVRHILCEKQSKVGLTFSPTSALTVDRHQVYVCEVSLLALNPGMSKRLGIISGMDCRVPRSVSALTSKSSKG